MVASVSTNFCHTGKAGMSGGIAYVLDADGSFASKCNMEMVEVFLSQFCSIAVIHHNLLLQY